MISILQVIKRVISAVEQSREGRIYPRGRVCQSVSKDCIRRHRRISDELPLINGRAAHSSRAVLGRAGRRGWHNNANSVKSARNFALHARRVLSGSDVCIETVVRLSEHALQMPPLPVLASFGAFRRLGETTIPITHKHNYFLFLFTDRTVYYIAFSTHSKPLSTRHGESPAGWLPWVQHVRKSISSPVHRKP